MPQGDKRKYSDKQVREAEHIAEGYRKRGKDEKWSKQVAWATVNKVCTFPALPSYTYVMQPIGAGVSRGRGSTCIALVTLVLL